MSFKLDLVKYHLRSLDGSRFTIIRSLHGFGTKDQLKICLADILRRNQHLSAQLFDGTTIIRMGKPPLVDDVIMTEPTTGEIEVLIEFEQGLHSNVAQFLCN